jgi:hypothetical protein
MGSAFSSWRPTTSLCLTLRRQWNNDRQDTKFRLALVDALSRLDVLEAAIQEIEQQEVQVKKQHQALTAWMSFQLEQKRPPNHQHNSDLRQLSRLVVMVTQQRQARESDKKRLSRIMHHITRLKSQQDTNVLLTRFADSGITELDETDNVVDFIDDIDEQTREMHKIQKRQDDWAQTDTPELSWDENAMTVGDSSETLRQAMRIAGLDERSLGEAVRQLPVTSKQRSGLLPVEIVPHQAPPPGQELLHNGGRRGNFAQYTSLATFQ